MITENMEIDIDKEIENILQLDIGDEVHGIVIDNEY